MSNYNFGGIQAVSDSWGTDETTRYNFHEPKPNNIICYVGATEMLKIGPDGFWVRGVKVAQDDKEAEAVYNGFKQFLVWSELNRR
jgi:hypothetical protein